MHVPTRASVLLIVSLTGTAWAQATRGGVELPTSTLTEQTDAAALAVNPAQLALLRGWSLSYLHSDVRDSPTAGTGHGLFFAMPLPLGFGWGAGVELVRPEDPDASWRSPFSLGLSWQHASRLSLGVTSRWFFSADDPALNGLWAVDLGLTLRLSPHLALALATHGVNNPRPQTINSLDHERFGRQWSAGFVVRPLPVDVLSLHGEVAYAEAWNRLAVRGVLALRPLPGWTVRADVTGWFDNGEADLTLALGTELSLSLLTLEGTGSLAGLQDGHPSFGGYSLRASVGDDGRSVLWEPRRVVHIMLDDALTTRSLATLEHNLLRALHDPAVHGLLLTPRAGFNASLAEIQDLRWLLTRLQRAGKPVACYLDDASGSAFYLCANADRLLVNEAGGIRLTGLRMSALYLGEALDSLGVQFQVLRLGEYKSAPEQLTQPGPSPETQEQTSNYLSSVYRRYLWDVAQDRQMTSQQVEQIIDNGPYLAHEAVEAGLADGTIYADQLEDRLDELFGGRVFYDSGYEDSLERVRSWPGGSSIAVIHVEGNLVDGESFEAGPSWLRMVGARTLIRALEQARLSRRVKAVVLRIDSPGGSVLASDLVWREIWRTRQVKPVVASMGGVAASGGYYLASAANEILAAPATLTGSIGVFYGKFELSRLLEKIGIHPFSYSRGRRAGHNDWTRPWTPDERRAFSQKVQQFYDRFLDRIVTGRPQFDSRAAVDRIARGRIWSGADAQRLGLVDRMGGLQHAVERAARLAGLGERYQVENLPRRSPSLTELAVDLIGLRAAAAQPPTPPALQRALRAVGPLAYTEPFSAQALLPFALELEL